MERLEFIRAVTIFVSVFFCSQALAYTDSPLDFQKVGAALNTSTLKCPERLWPGFSLKSVNVLMSAEGLPTSLWRPATSSVGDLAADKIPAEAFDSLYSFPEFEGREAAAIYVSKSDQEHLGFASSYSVFRLIVHESFHRFGQRNWIYGKFTPRGAQYPVSATPRLYRRMLFGYLFDYFVSAGKNRESLARAAFWNNKWIKEAPQEYFNDIDRLEGTAQYVELIAAILADGGCDLSEADIYKELAGPIAGEYSTFLHASNFIAVRENYDLGSLAAFILRFVDGRKNWEERVMQGVSPLDLVLEGVEKKTDKLPEPLKNRFSELAAAFNKRLGMWLDADIRLLNDPNSIRIVPEAESFQTGAFTSNGFYTLKESPKTMAIPLALPVKFSRSDWKLDVAAEKVMFGGVESPCSGEYVLAVPKQFVRVGPGKMQIHAHGLDGEMPGELVTDARGKVWFCGAASVLKP